MTDHAGPLLCRAGLITRAELVSAYEGMTRAPGRTLIEELIASGAADEDRLCRFFHDRLLVPLAGADELLRASRRALELVPREMASEFRCVPLRVDAQGNLALAMADPSDTHAVDEIQFMSGATVLRVAAPASAIAQAIQMHYGTATPLPIIPPPVPMRLPLSSTPSDPIAATAPHGMRRLAPALVVDDIYHEDTPIPLPVPFDESSPVVIELRSPGGDPAAAALRDALRSLETVTARDTIGETLLIYLRRLCRRTAFLAVRRGELVGHLGSGQGIYTQHLRNAVLTLDRPSIFRDLIAARLPYRGPVADNLSRNFLIDGLGWAPDDMLALPLAVRDRVVAVLYGDGRFELLPDEHLATLARAAEQALERVIVLRKASLETDPYR